MIPPRFALREATRAVHERLHRIPVFEALAAGTLGRDTYVALLGRLYGFHGPTEAALEAALDLPRLGIRPRSWRRVHLLREDLAAFGWDDAAVRQLPHVRLDAVCGHAAAMGALYVVEGSTLGGRQLARQLDPLLDGPAGRRFLAAGTEPDHLRWAALCRVLDEEGTDPARLAQMTEGALRTFALFELWFTGI